MTLPSEVIEGFATRARSHLTNDAPVPSPGSSDVETRRAREIAQAALDGGLVSLSQPPIATDIDLSKPMTAHDLEERIRHFARQQHRAGSWELRDLAIALADLAKAADELELAFGWDPDASLRSLIGSLGLADLRIRSGTHSCRQPGRCRTCCSLRVQLSRRDHAAATQAQDDRRGRYEADVLARRLSVSRLSRWDLPLPTVRPLGRVTRSHVSRLARRCRCGALRSTLVVEAAVAFTQRESKKPLTATAEGPSAS